MKKSKLIISFILVSCIFFSVATASVNAAYPTNPTSYTAYYHTAPLTICTYKDSSKWYHWRRTVTDPVRHSHGYTTTLSYQRTVTIGAQVAAEFSVELGGTIDAVFVEASLKTGFGLSISGKIDVAESTSVAYTIAPNHESALFRISVVSEAYHFRNDVYYGSFQTPPTASQTPISSAIVKLPICDPYVALLTAPLGTTDWCLAEK